MVFRFVLSVMMLLMLMLLMLKMLSVANLMTLMVADDVEICGLMRICAYADAIRKTKSVCA